MISLAASDDQERYGFYRPVIRKVVKKFLGCGDLTQGFARVQCGQCQGEFLLPFSCKGRYFCPSCYQKRVLQFGEWVTLRWSIKAFPTDATSCAAQCS